MIKSSFTWDNNRYEIEYYPTSNVSELPKVVYSQVYGLCYCGNSLVITFNNKYKVWNLVGGTIEKDENYIDALYREVSEETNMEVVKWQLLGYQRTTSSIGEATYQLRVYCKVKPKGKFISDPAGSVTKIKLINPRHHKKYFNWGVIGEELVNASIATHDKSSLS